MSDQVEAQHVVHARATGRNQSGKAEALGPNTAVPSFGNVNERAVSADSTGSEVGTAIAQGDPRTLATEGASVVSAIGERVGMAAGALVGGVPGAIVGSQLGKEPGELISELANTGAGADDEVPSPERRHIADGTANWGRGGETTTTRERGSETIPAAALVSMAIQPQMGTTSPEPDQLSRPVRPDSPHGADGNWNMSDIANYKIGG